MADTITRKGVLSFVTQGTEKAKSEIGGLDNTMDGLKSTILGAVSAYTALQVVQTAMEWGEEAARLRDVQGAFENMGQAAGVDTVKLLEKMRTATNRTVSELSLMQKANTAMMLDLPVDRFDEILAIARGAAISTGQSMEFMLESIVTGLGRQSKMILDNLGILVSVEDANEAYAASVGKTVSALTDQERKQAFVNAALDAGIKNLDKMGGLTTSATDGYVQMEVALEELKVTMGELVPNMDAAGGAIMDFNDDIKDGLPKLKLYVELARNLSFAMSTLGQFAMVREYAKTIYGREDESEQTVAAFGENVKAYQERKAKEAGEASAEAFAKATAERLRLLSEENEYTRGLDFFSNILGDHVIDPAVLAEGDWAAHEALMERTDALRELSEISAEAYPMMGESVSWYADVAENALDRVIFKNQAVVSSLKNLIVAQNISTKSVGQAVQAAVRAELAGIAARSAVDAAYYTYKGIAATASMLAGNPLGAGVAQAYFTAAAKAGAVAGLAGIGASIGPSMSAPAYSPVSGEYGDAGMGDYGTDSSGQSIHVTRTAPTHINVVHNYYGTVNYGSQAASDAAAIQEHIDAGALYLGEEVA